MHNSPTSMRFHMQHTHVHLYLRNSLNEIDTRNILAYVCVYMFVLELIFFAYVNITVTVTI